MKSGQRAVAAFLFGFFISGVAARGEEQPAAPLPPGVNAVWDLSKAWHETTPTRERVCINGLWHFQPAKSAADAPPDKGWGWFKVPGCWPGVGDYLQKDSQTIYPHPSWEHQNIAEIASAWYERQIEIPKQWEARRIALSLEYLNSFAIAYIDGKKAGEIRFPAGEIDLTTICPPGTKHNLCLLVLAMPLKAVFLSYADTAAAKEVKGSVERRGLCGDAYLVSTPSGSRIGDARVSTSVRNWDILFDVGLDDLAADRAYRLRARISDANKEVIEFTSKTFTSADLKSGRYRFSEKWKPNKLWDLHTPQNLYDAQLTLMDAAGGVRDVATGERFGFRELWIDGRNFILNGTPLFLSAVPFDNATIGAAAATESAARETFRRLKRLGINFVYAHNYDCEPGSHLSLAEILRAADAEGMLFALTQPHFAGYDWEKPDAEQNNNYALHAAFYVRVAASHPSVVFYAMSHNATGYSEDMNPDLLDGQHDAREQWSRRNMVNALRAEAIVRQLDSSRVVYHHAGGNIGSMHTSNFYPNWAPIQELDDWFGHWAETGTKPAFMCEYGAPFSWDWAMYRGWYKGEREFGSAAVPWEWCMAEWNAQFLGDRAFAISDREKANIRWEAEQFRAGNTWHRWDYPTEMGSPRFEDRNTVMAMYLTDNWRAYRTWGVSGISPWEYGMFWIPRDGVDRGRKELPVDWDNLQRPGYSPDYIADRVQRIDTAYEFADWIPTAVGQAVLRNNQPVLAYIAGKPQAFTSKDHIFRAGETVEKQLIVINDSRQSVNFQCEWSLRLPQPVAGEVEVSIDPGRQKRLPLHFALPPALPAGAYEIHARVRFGDGQEQTDSFTLDVIPGVDPALKIPARISLFDPAGQSADWLTKHGVTFERVDAKAELGPDDILIVGKLAMSVDGPAPDVSRVRDGLKVIFFEQSADVLEKRLGFRVQSYGLRQVFRRVSDHPLLSGLNPPLLRDWRGSATTNPPQLKYEVRERYGPTIQWCGIPVTRVWRCGNRGNVASVVIEKPARGDFRPILDGGYSLQYSPLLEYREGKGMAIFCQLDVTGRTETDPIADELATRILNYAGEWKPRPKFRVVYAGEPAGRQFLESIGVKAKGFAADDLSSDLLLVAGPGAAAVLAPHAQLVQSQCSAGGVISVGLDEREMASFLPFFVGARQAEHIASTFDPPHSNSPIAYIGPADVMNRAPRSIPLITRNAESIYGDGVLAVGSGVTYCQLVPWRFDYSRSYGVKRTYRRSAYLFNRLLANLGGAGTTPILDRIHSPCAAPDQEKRYLSGLYLDTPEEMDDPYRFFRW